MPRYSSLQRYEILPNRYRVKDYQLSEWIPVEKVFLGWKFRWKTFKTANQLNKYLKEENKMAEQNEAHYQVQDENKARKYEANKKKREEVKQFIDRCDERKLTEIHAEVTRLKRGFYL
jgi:hypothetical protein